MKSCTFTILGKPESMKNRRRIFKNRTTGRAMLVKSAAALSYEADFLRQVPRSAILGLGSKANLIRLSVRLFYPDWRSDADCALICDLLQKAGVISNDRWIRVLAIDAREIDAENPRAEIRVEEMG